MSCLQFACVLCILANRHLQLSILDNILFIQCKFSNQQCFKKKKKSRKCVYWFLLSSQMSCCKLSVRTWMPLTCLFLLCIFSILLVGMLSALLISNQNNYSSLKIQDCVTFKEPFPRQIDKILIVDLPAISWRWHLTWWKLLALFKGENSFHHWRRWGLNFRCCIVALLEHSLCFFIASGA